MRTHWLLSELRELDSGFDTTALIRSLRTKYQGNQSVLAEIKMKRVSGKLNRLCCMRFLSREKVKRQIFVKDNSFCFRGYKYRYKLTKQGISYLKYVSEKKKLRNSASSSTSTYPDHTSSTGTNVGPIIEDMVNRKIEQRENQLKQALREQYAKNHLLEKELDDERFRSMVALAVIVRKARQEVEARNSALRHIISMLDTTAALERTIQRDFVQKLSNITSEYYILPGWMT